MNFSNTKRILESLSLTLTRLNNERAQYNSEINRLSDQDYRRRYSEDAQAEDRTRINNTFRVQLTASVSALRTEAAKFQDAFEKDTHSVPCEREALNSCLMYLNISKAAYDKAALEALMMPIIEKKDYNSYLIIYKACASFFDGNAAEMGDFPHSEILRVFWYWEEFKTMFGHVKKHIDNLIDPDTIPLGCAVIECGDQSETIAYLEMLKKECIPELENPKNIISPETPAQGIGFSLDGFKRIR